MNPFKKLTNIIKNSFQDDVRNKTLFGWHSTGFDVMAHYKENQYENGYGSISKIVNAFMDVEVYTVNEKAENTPSRLKDKLYHPNQDMSSSDFREALAVMSLIHDRVFVLVWREENGEAVPGGEITPDNIAGFTFLQNPVVTLSDGVKTYSYNGRAYTDKEVIELKDINPYNLHAGYAPAKAAAKWANIDDYIAAYQTGFFKNGAVPAGQFIITAPTPQDFNDEVDKLEARHKGAGKNNNIVYVHRPTDRDGKASNAQIEWVPFNVQNKDLALNDIFEQANKKIDSVYGVPAEIRGILSNSNYASVNVAETIFIKYVVKPFTKKIWTRFNHQLDRITGGMGVGISFKLDVPGLADQEKVEEETLKVRDERVQLYLDRGYTIESINDYLKTNDLTALEKAPAPEYDDADIDEGDEVKDAPDAPDGSGDGITNEVAIRPNPKVIKAQSDFPEIDSELVPYEQQIEDLLTAQIDRQAQRASDAIQDNQEPTEEENDSMAEELLAILLALMLLRGKETYNEQLATLAGEDIPLDDTSQFTYEMTEDDINYAKETVKSFNEDTSNAITVAVSAALLAGATSDELKTMLASFSTTQDYRINRFAQNEAWRSSEKAGLEAVKQLNHELNSLVSSYKTWTTQSGACVLCTDYSNQTVLINETFTDGVDMPPLHVQCRCKLTYAIKKVEVQDKVTYERHCSACDRFVGFTDNKEYSEQDKCKCGALDVPKVRLPDNL